MVVNRNIARPFPPSREKACSRLDGKCRAMFRLLSRTCEIISRTFDIVCRYYHEIPTRRTRTIYIWYKRGDSLIKKCVSGLYLKYCHFPWNMKKKNDTTIRVVFLFLLLFKQTVSNLFCGQPLRKTETNACKFLTSSFKNHNMWMQCRNLN